MLLVLHGLSVDPATWPVGSPERAAATKGLALRAQMEAERAAAEVAARAALADWPGSVVSLLLATATRMSLNECSIPED